MKTIIAGTICLFVLAGTLAQNAGAREKPPVAAPTLASLVELAAGDVRVEDAAGSRPAGTGAMLATGAALEVGAGGRCLVRLSAGARVFLRERTRVVLTDAGIEVAKGEAWVEVPSLEEGLFTVRAGGAVVSAEKAGFDVRLDPAGLRVIVMRGLAVVEAPQGRAEVGAGESAAVPPSSAGGPKVSAVDYWEDWTGGMADHGVLPSSAGRGSGRIFAIDRARAGAAPQELQVREQSVRIEIRDGIARTEVTQAFFNPAGTPVEGWYWFTIPEGAAVTRFALQVNGQLVDGEVVERKQAAASYEAAVQRAFDPALLEWVDGRTYRARIFPIPAAGERRVVLGYSEVLPRIRGVTRYVYPMGDGDPVRVQEFSLSADVGGGDTRVRTVGGARVESGPKGARLVTMRRSGFTPRGDFLLELEDPPDRDPMRVVRYPSPAGGADYVMVRYSPEEDWDAAGTPEGALVLVVDTSAGGDAGERKLKNDAVEAVLRSLSAGDRFAVVAADVSPRLVYPATEGLADAAPANVDAAMERLSEVPTGGATDLGETFSVALKLAHGARQPAVVYIGDGRATVGELRSAELVERLKRSLSGSPARLFTLAVGLRANTALLSRLARVGGGAPLRVDVPEQTVQRAIELVGAVKTPTITDLKVDVGAGLDQVFVTGAGKVMRGQEVLLFGRTHHPLPGKVRVTGTLGGRPFARDYCTDELKGPAHAYVAPLWAMEYLEFLLGTGADENRGQVIALGLEYSLMTPFTSFLVLENPAAYAAAGIVRRDRDGTWNGPALEAAADDSTAARSIGTGTKVAKGSGASSAGGGRSEVVDGRRGGPRYRADPVPASHAPDAGPGGYLSVLREPARRDVAAEGTGEDFRPDRERSAGTFVAADLATGRGVVLPGRTGGPDRPDVPLGVCSDAAGRPLAARIGLWQRRLAGVAGVAEALGVWRQAAADCELDGWNAEKALLGLVLDAVRTPADASTLVSAFGRRPRVQDWLRMELLKRVVADGAIGLPTEINWAGVDAVLGAFGDASARLEALRRVLAYRPSDPEGLRRELGLLIETRASDEAIRVATRLRDLGFGTPTLLMLLGDLRAERGDVDGAKRAYSEIAENNAWDPTARRMLGDAFLRHGWYEDAYRQYGTLLFLSAGDPAAIVRFARAAAGAGRTDEALRVLRGIFELALPPSSSDPREWARLWSVDVVARLLASSADDPEKRKALVRSLKRTEAFRDAGTLYLLTWQDLGASLSLRLETAGGAPASADAVVAGDTGLASAFSTSDGPAPAVARAPGGPARAVAWHLAVVTFDGREFRVTERTGEAPVAAPPPAPRVVRSRTRTR